MLNAVDGQSLGSPGRYLLTATVRSANRHMGWNEDRTTFGTAWGEGPTLAEAPPITLDLSAASPIPRVYALNPDGTRKHELHPTSPRRIEATPASQTLWFEIVLP